jgi:hypothetical protein
MRRNIAQIKEGILSGVVTAQSGMTARLANPAITTRNAWLLAGIVTPLFATSTAFAAKGGCSSGAANKLFGFVNDFARLMIGFGAVGSLLMLAVGAGFIMFSAGNEGRARKGMGIVKNVVVALMIFGGGIFIKYIVLQVVAGATTFSAPSCIKSNETTAP